MRRRKETNEVNNEQENPTVRKRKVNVKEEKRKIEFKKLDLNKINMDKKQILKVGVICLIVLLIILFANYTKVGIVFNKKITDKNTIHVDLTTNKNSIYPYKNEVLIYSPGKLATYNKHGKQTWSTTIEGIVGAKVSTAGKYIQVINEDKALAYIYKDKYECARIKVDGDILSGTINEKGDSVIEYTSTGAKKTLAVYNKSGKLKYNVKLSNNIIGQYVLSDDSKYLAYIDVNIQGISAASTVNVVDFSKSSDNLNVEKIQPETSDLIYDLTFNKNKLSYRLEKQVITYNLNNKTKKVSEMEKEGITNIDIDKSKFAYVVANADGTYSFSIRKIGAKESKLVALREMPKSFEYIDGNVFVCYQKHIDIYNSLKMNIKQYESDMVIANTTVFNEGKSVAVLLSDKIVIFTI